MQSVVLTVVTPAPSFDLTTLATVKAELGLLTTAEDVNLALWITQASAACAAYCNRVFASETVIETFRNRFNFRFRNDSTNRVDAIRLERYPVTSIVSMTEDAIPLVVDVDYQLDASTGMMYRLDATNDAIMQWDFQKLAVQYAGGYALLGALPYNIERACITAVEVFRSSAARDARVKQESIPGVLETQYWVGASGDDGALPPDVTAMLDPFRNVWV
jgi:hypothetical protein